MADANEDHPIGLIEVRVADPTGAPIIDASLDSLFTQVRSLSTVRIAHGALSTHTIVVGEDGIVGLLDFRSATTSANTEQLNRDLAAALAASAVVVGAERTVAAASRVMPEDAISAALPFLQRAALDPVAARTLRGRKRCSPTLGNEGPRLSTWTSPSWPNRDGSAG